jgi:hypothetical protein
MNTKDHEENRKLFDGEAMSSWFLYFAILHFAFSDFIHEGIPGYKIKFSFFSTMYNLSELCGFVFTWDEFGLVWDVNGCPMFEQ